jgi:16S rRNA processing protein RimM
MSKDEYNISIGEITAPFGRKGEVKVRLDTDFPERFEELEEVFISGGNITGCLMEIEDVWFQKSSVILKFPGVDDITAAEEFRGAKIYIRESDLMPTEEDEYYIHDLNGLEVVTTEGEHLGRIKEVLRSPAHDIYVTDKAMIPAVKEYIESIDLAEGKVIVKHDEGLITEEKPNS